MACYEAELQELDFFMMDYYPKNSGLKDWDSQTLVYLKMGKVYDEHRKYGFVGRIKAWLSKCINEIKANHKEEEIILGFAPSHSPSSPDSFMITELDIDSLCQDPLFSVHPKLLERVVEVPKQATGGVRSIGIHLNSIQVTKDITGKIVCILDDIWTTGCTLNACIELVKQGGAKQVYILAIAKTVSLYGD